MKVDLDCIVCPAGCRIEVEVSGDGEVEKVSGNRCRRGAEYGKTEVKAPVRMVTGTVPVDGGCVRRLPVVTSAPVPREKVFQVMEKIHHIGVCAPVSIDDIIVENICGLGVDLKAGRTVGVGRDIRGREDCHDREPVEMPDCAGHIFHEGF